LRAVAKKLTGATALLRVAVQCNAPTGAKRLQPGELFGASKAKQKPPRGEA